MYTNAFFEIRGGDVFFTFRGTEYRLLSQPFEPCLYLRRTDEVLSPEDKRLGKAGKISLCLHNSFTADDIARMIRTGENLRDAGGQLMDTEVLADACAIALSEGRTDLTLTYALELVFRKRQSLPRYLYLGEAEREFMLTFTHSFEPEYFSHEEDVPEFPMGIITVPGDYADSWIRDRAYYLGWKTVYVPAEAEKIPGYDPKHRWKLLADEPFPCAEWKYRSTVCRTVPSGAIRSAPGSLSWRIP